VLEMNLAGDIPDDLLVIDLALLQNASPNRRSR
jgi:hypothetical protein